MGDVDMDGMKTEKKDTIHIIGTYGNMVRLYIDSGETGDIQDIECRTVINSLNSGSIQVVNNKLVNGRGNICNTPTIGDEKSEGMLYALKIIVDRTNKDVYLVYVNTMGDRYKTSIRDIIKDSALLEKLYNFVIIDAHDEDYLIQEKFIDGQKEYVFRINETLVTLDSRDKKYIEYFKGTLEENRGIIARAKMVYSVGGDEKLAKFINTLRPENNVRFQIELFRMLNMDIKEVKPVELRVKHIKIDRERAESYNVVTIAMLNFIDALDIKTEGANTLENKLEVIREANHGQTEYNTDIRIVSLARRIEENGCGYDYAICDTAGYEGRLALDKMDIVCLFNSKNISFSKIHKALRGVNIDFDVIDSLFLDHELRLVPAGLGEGFIDGDKVSHDIIVKLSWIMQQLSLKIDNKEPWRKYLYMYNNGSLVDVKYTLGGVDGAYAVYTYDEWTNNKKILEEIRRFF